MIEIIKCLNRLGLFNFKISLRNCLRSCDFQAKGTVDISTVD